jgi:DinB superfamily
MLTIEDVAKQSREERLSRMTHTADQIALAIGGQPETVLAKRPSMKAWAGKEVVCHLRDTEESFMSRFQTIAAMDDPRLLGVDPDRWADERQYLRNDAVEALHAFRRRREESLTYLKNLAPQQWQRGGVHPSRGRMTVDDLVTLMAWHDENHLEQLKRALRGEA